MNWTESIVFLINFIFLFPIIIYVFCTFNLLILKYNIGSLDKYLNLGEQSKLIKTFSEKYLDIKKDREKLLREVYAQQLTTHPNVSARFVAYCIRREIPNLNFIFYLFNLCHSSVYLIDSKGEHSLRLKCKRSNIYIAFILGNIGLLSYAVIFVYFLSLSLTSTGGWIFNIMISIGIIFLSIKNYKTFCLIFLVNQLDDVVYGGLSKFEKTCYISWCSRLFDTICCRNRKQNMSAFESLKNLEYKQLQHDDRYHKDIWVLSTQGKVRHMAAHIGKYSSQVLSAVRNGQDEERIKNKVIDSLIINLSYANIFLCLISEHLEKKNTSDQATLDELIQSVGQLYIEQKRYEGRSDCGLELAMDFCVLSGEILKTVESMDHMEIHPYRESFNEYSLSIFKILSGLCKKYEINDIAMKIEDRLLAVEKRNPYFSRLGNHKEGYLQ
ncbi:hypothetical protein [Acinetobacter sp. 243_ASPC]|nr:hypothetical protein [Acinetobacter sp. 243_ASPC]